MSFSIEVKSELCKIIPPGRHCQLAEMAAIVYFAGTVSKAQDGQPEIIITSENEAIQRKYFTLLKKAFNIEAGADKVFQALRLERDDVTVSSLLLKNTCCRRAYLRSIFTLIGSISNPVSGYHLEFVFNYEQQAKQLKTLLSGFSLESRITKRKKYTVVYIKEGAVVVDLLNIMGAHHALLRLENLRVEKEVRNLVNRKVNCEAANISKTVFAAARQIEDITYLKEHCGFLLLPDNLRQIAEVRLQYPEATLQELGELLEPPIGKSGVNHRLRKLSELANNYNKNKAY